MSDNKLVVKIYWMNSNQAMANITETVEERGIHKKNNLNVRELMLKVEHKIYGKWKPNPFIKAGRISGGTRRDQCKIHKCSSNQSLRQYLRLAGNCRVLC